ncbi:proline-rich receptor-like protein kinase PERK10 [Sphaeramia orbicularis]|uniref:proline-rich receptor-like protein kinase PERK10 n=1 Tax=Sphaeramia orbicularis TaxID=375764 RepID=UPI00117FF2FA|nr:proline-rich receptor-like protein kinase PERK10 [Sphaeramia orbicularis]
MTSLGKDLELDLDLKLDLELLQEDKHVCEIQQGPPRSGATQRPRAPNNHSQKATTPPEATHTLNHPMQSREHGPVTSCPKAPQTGAGTHHTPHLPSLTCTRDAAITSTVPPRDPARDPATRTPAPGPNRHHGRTPPSHPERTPSDTPHPPQGPQPPRHTCSPPPPPPPHHNPPSFTKHATASPGQPRHLGACRVPPPPREGQHLDPRAQELHPAHPSLAQPPDPGDTGHRPKPNPEPPAPPPQGYPGVGSTPAPTGTNTKPPPEQGGPEPHSEGPLVTCSPAAPPASLLTLRVM